MTGAAGLEPVLERAAGRRLFQRMAVRKQSEQMVLVPRAWLEEVIQRLDALLDVVDAASRTRVDINMLKLRLRAVLGSEEETPRVPAADLRRILRKGDGDE